MRYGASTIAIALIDAGSDPNFVESSSVNAWNSPPLHDGVEIAVWATLEQDDDFIEAHLAAIRHLLDAGARKSCARPMLVNPMLATWPATFRA